MTARSQQSAYQVVQRHIALVIEDASKHLTRDEKDALAEDVHMRVRLWLERPRVPDRPRAA